MFYVKSYGQHPKKDSQNLSYVLVLTMGFLGVSHDVEAHEWKKHALREGPMNSRP